MNWKAELRSCLSQYGQFIKNLEWLERRLNVHEEDLCIPCVRNMIIGFISSIPALPAFRFHSSLPEHKSCVHLRSHDATSQTLIPEENSDRIDDPLERQGDDDNWPRATNSRPALKHLDDITNTQSKASRPSPRRSQRRKRLLSAKIPPSSNAPGPVRRSAEIVLNRRCKSMAPRLLRGCRGGDSISGSEFLFGIPSVEDREASQRCRHFSPVPRGRSPSPIVESGKEDDLGNSKSIKLPTGFPLDADRVYISTPRREEDDVVDAAAFKIIDIVPVDENRAGYLEEGLKSIDSAASRTTIANGGNLENTNVTIADGVLCDAAKSATTDSMAMVTVDIDDGNSWLRDIGSRNEKGGFAEPLPMIEVIPGPTEHSYKPRRGRGRPIRATVEGELTPAQRVSEFPGSKKKSPRVKIGMKTPRKKKTTTATTTKKAQVLRSISVGALGALKRNARGSDPPPPNDVDLKRGGFRFAKPSTGPPNVETARRRSANLFSGPREYAPFSWIEQSFSSNQGIEIASKLRLELDSTSIRSDFSFCSEPRFGSSQSQPPTTYRSVSSSGIEEDVEKDENERVGACDDLISRMKQRQDELKTPQKNEKNFGPVIRKHVKGSRSVRPRSKPESGVPSAGRRTLPPRNKRGMFSVGKKGSLKAVIRETAGVKQRSKSPLEQPSCRECRVVLTPTRINSSDSIKFQVFC